MIDLHTAKHRSVYDRQESNQLTTYHNLKDINNQSHIIISKKEFNLQLVRKGTLSCLQGA